MREIPDLIVGVDFGMTFTGVAWQKRGMDSPHVIKKWPGSRENVFKVPTELDYKNGKVYRWGFECDDQIEPDMLHCEWFKRLLDPKELRKEQRLHPDSTPESIDTVKKWYTDFLACIYQYTKGAIKRTMADDWCDTRIEFLFSLPTTWTSQTLVEDFRDIIKHAGFGSESGKHSVSIGLTEAEAAAVYTAKNRTAPFKEGDVVLICDAGGGTTDASIMKTVSTDDDFPSLVQLIPVQGENFGATNIDSVFEEVVKRRLDIKDPSQPKRNMALSFRAIKSTDFLSKKYFYGDTYNELGELSFKIYDDTSITVEAAGIRKGKLVLQGTEFEQLFVNLTRRMSTLIDKQLRQLRDTYPAESVKYLVLSGGLGCNPYVQQKIEERYGSFMKVLLSEEPQEAVVRGLVMDQWQKHLRRPVIITRCCRKSYGVLCSQVYNDKSPDHINRPTVIDPIDGKRYVPDMIQWFIRMGEQISVLVPIEHRFYRNIKPGDPNRKWKTKVVVSSAPILPSSLQQDGASLLCEVESDLSGIQQNQFQEVKKRGGCCGSSTSHFKAEYSIQVNIGPADIQFELNFQGRSYSNGERIGVEWTDPPVAEKNNLNGGIPGDIGIF